MAKKTDIQQAMDDHPAIGNALAYWCQEVIPMNLNKHNWNRTSQQTKMADMVQDMRTTDMLIAVAFMKYILEEVGVKLQASDAKFLREIESQIHDQDFFELEYSGKDSRKQNPVHNAKWRTLMLLIDIAQAHMNMNLNNTTTQSGATV